MSDEEKVGYYAIIPATVRYDDNISPNAKLLYGEITVLCNKEGCCWASNAYFSKLYKASIRSITRWIAQLVDGGYIKSTITYKTGTKEVDGRYIKICDTPIDKNVSTLQTEMSTLDKNVDTLSTKMSNPYRQKCLTPIDKNVQENNTSINNTSINNTSINNNSRKAPVFYPNDEKLDLAFKDYVDMRKKIKSPMTDRAIELAIKKVEELSGGDNDVAIKILNQSVMNSWKGLFELKGQDNKRAGYGSSINWDEV